MVLLVFMQKPKYGFVFLNELSYNNNSNSNNANHGDYLDNATDGVIHGMPHCGVGFMWKRSLDQCTTIFDSENDT